MKTNKWIGLAFITFPLLINIPFALLASRFDYPDILRAPPGQLLERFHRGGSSLVLTWYAFAIVTLPALAAIVALPFVERDGLRARAAVAATFGVLASVLQLVGLIRWTFAVPPLAELYTDPAASEATRAAATTTFVALHQYAGVALGEHLGQLLTALWMAFLGAHMSNSREYPHWLGRLAYAGALLWVVGLAEGFATVLPFPLGPLGFVAPFAFLVMGGWMMALGVVVWRRPM